PVERKGLEMGQRGVSGAEVVDHDADALRLQALDVRQRVLPFADEAALRNLELEPAGREIRQRQDPQQTLRQQRVLELDRRHVDGDLEMRRPLLRRQQGLLHDRQRDFADQATGFGDAEEVRRLEHAIGRMLPASQRLEAFHLAAGELVDRLEVGDELAGLDSMANFGLERGPLAEFDLHRLVELDPAVLSRGLGLVHREGGPPQQPARPPRHWAMRSVPEAWAAYIAGSAGRSSERASRDTPCSRAIPIDAPPATIVSPSWTGIDIASTSFSASNRGCFPRAREPRSSTANSSPPSRTQQSSGMQQLRILSAVDTSTASPTSCPCRSLTALNWSRSISSSATSFSPLTSRSPAKTCRWRRLCSPVTSSK